ncbi:MAG: TrkH family potassium uptake protein [Candidatus Omnitrophota bacterium]|nr:TrkH family potassium uptake protein [Candidatus Omnitrophota bacterium]
MNKLSPPQIVALSFLLVIIIGTVLLSLPISIQGRETIDIIDAIFTATSATCVTGLIVKDTGSFFSPFGRAIILLLFQCGGLGIMTLSTLFAVLLGRKLTIRRNVIVQSALGRHKIEGLTTLVKYILCFTFGIELLGAGLLFLRWIQGPGVSIKQAAWWSVFHAVSAFCNAGFSLFSDSFAGYRGDWYVILVMSIMIILGGLGFVVLMDTRKLKFWRRNKAFIFKTLNLQSKVVLTLTVFLILIGIIFFLFSEGQNTLKGLSFKDKILVSSFQSVTSRTAGFNTINIGALRMGTLFFLMFLMFIGASPGSTGGGIKTATFGVVAAGLWAMIKNKKEVSIFKRTIPKDVVRKALVVFLMALGWILLFSLALSVVEGENVGRSSNSFLPMLFEVTSAFGTVGLSTGLSSNLTSLGKVLIILTMYAGRIGPLTLALAIALREEKVIYRYPEERIMVG